MHRDKDNPKQLHFYFLSYERHSIVGHYIAFYVFIGATVGATAAFLVGRYLARGCVVKKIEGNPKFRAIDEAVGREGFKIVLLTLTTNN